MDTEPCITVKERDSCICCTIQIPSKVQKFINELISGSNIIQTNLTVASKWTFYIVLDVNYFVFIFHFSKHVKAKVSSFFFFLQERKRLKIIVKTHIYMHIFANISEVL